MVTAMKHVLLYFCKDEWLPSLTCSALKLSLTFSDIDIHDLGAEIASSKLFPSSRALKFDMYLFYQTYPEYG